jgi:Flp pilus assembly protein TadG
MAARDDRGVGLLASAAGVVVFLMFLMLSVQLLFSLYASSTITAVANDAAQRAADANAPPLDVIEEEARATLGRIGDSATFGWSTDDADGDGLADTVVLDVVARPPRFVPASIGDGIGLGPLRRTIRVRVEELQ